MKSATTRIASGSSLLLLLHFIAAMLRQNQRGSSSLNTGWKPQNFSFLCVFSPKDLLHTEVENQPRWCESFCFQCSALIGLLCPAHAIQSGPIVWIQYQNIFASSSFDGNNRDAACTDLPGGRSLTSSLHWPCFLGPTVTPPPRRWHTAS